MSETMDELDYLMNAAKSDAGFKKADLSDLAMLIEARDKFAKEAAELEEELKKKQAQFRFFDEQEIPNFLRSAGMTSITMADGRKVSYKDEISATLNKEFERDFFKFLEQRGDTDIIKLSYDFPRMEPSKQRELEAAVKQVISDFEKKESVHSATLKKYIKDLLGTGKTYEEITEGLDNGSMVREDDVSGFINLYRYAKTTIK